MSRACFAGQHGGAGEPVADDGVAQGEVDDLGDVGGDRLRARARVGQCAQARAAGEDGAAEQPVPGDLVVEPQQLFADALRVGVQRAVADVVAQRAEVGDVVVEPFQLEQDRPDRAARRGGTGQSEGVLDGEAERQGVADGGVAADPFGQRRPRRRAVRPSESFSMPLWTNQSRALSLRMVSPTTEKRKWPGSISPAWTGPTGIS